MAKPSPAECPSCDQLIRRIWVMRKHEKVGMKWRDHTAPCGLPCKTAQEAKPGEHVHSITDECERCQAVSKFLVNGKVVDRRTYSKPIPVAPIKIKTPPTPPEPKVPWERIIIPPHALKMAKIRAGFESIVDAAIMIEMFYPLTQYNSSQKEAKGTSHTKRTKPGKNKHRSQRVDLYTVTHDGVEWVFYMKRNVLMTVHRNDKYDTTGPPEGQHVRLDNALMSSNAAG